MTSRSAVARLLLQSFIRRSEIVTVVGLGLGSGDLVDLVVGLVVGLMTSVRWRGFKSAFE